MRTNQGDGVGLEAGLTILQKDNMMNTQDRNELGDKLKHWGCMLVLFGLGLLALVLLAEYVPVILNSS